MEILFPSADAVVRSVMPCVLIAAGLEKEAARLTEINPILCKSSVVSACRKLNELCDTRGISPFWANVVKDAKFWCEAAIWAAAEGNKPAFQSYVEKMMEVMRREMPVVLLH